MYFNSSAKQLENTMQSSGMAKNQNKTSNKEKIDKEAYFTEIKNFLPPEFTPFGDQTISKPPQKISKNFVSKKESEKTAAVEVEKEPISKQAPKISSVLLGIQKDAEKLHDENKKQDKERKEKEKQEAEARKKERDEKLKKEEEERKAAESGKTEKKGLGLGGLGKRTSLSGSSGTGIKLSLGSGVKAAQAAATTTATTPAATEAAPATTEAAKTEEPTK